MKVVLGQAAKRFLPLESSRPLVLGGILIADHEGLQDDFDGDVILQSLCHAVSSLGHFQEFMNLSHELLEKDGITDSIVLLEKSLGFLKGKTIKHVSFSIELKKPVVFHYFEKMQENISRLLKIQKSDVSFSCFDSNGLSDVGCGDGISVLCALTLD